MNTSCSFTMYTFFFFIFPSLMVQILKKHQSYCLNILNRHWALVMQHVQNEFLGKLFFHTWSHQMHQYTNTDLLMILNYGVFVKPIQSETLDPFTSIETLWMKYGFSMLMLITLILGIDLHRNVSDCVARIVSVWYM